MGELLAVLALFMFSGNIILAKVASGRVEIRFGFVIVVLVNVAIAALLLSIQFALRNEPLSWNGVGLSLFAIAGVFSTYLGRWLFYDSVVKLGPAKASTFQVSNPIFTVLIAWVFLDESLSLLDMLAVLVILSGLFLVSYVPGGYSWRKALAEDPIRGDRRSDGVGSPKLSGIKTAVQLGSFLAFSGALAYAVGNVLRGAAIREWNEPILGALIGAAVGLLLQLLFSSGARRMWVRIRKSDSVGLLLYVGCGVLSILGQILVIASMHYIPVSIANLITLSTPILVTPLSFFLLRNEENINARTVFGIIVVLLGICTILLA